MPTKVAEKLQAASEIVPAEVQEADDKEKLSSTVGVLVLGSVTILWGAQHSTIKATLQDTDALEAAVLNLLRFSLAAACFSPWLPTLRILRTSMVWRGGIELGIWLFLGFCLQAVGLLYTTAQRSGLLLYLNVKFVPFIARFFFKRQVALSAWISAGAAFFGTFLVAGDGASGVPLNIGDVFSLAAAIASACFILRLECYASTTDAKELNSVCTFFVATLCIPWTLAEAMRAAPPNLHGGTLVELVMFACGQVASRSKGLFQNHLSALISLGVVTTAFTNWLQTIGQKSVSATTASVIYALDPLWGCLFAYLWLGEVLGPQGFCGCAMLIAFGSTNWYRLGVQKYKLKFYRKGHQIKNKNGLT